MEASEFDQLMEVIHAAGFRGATTDRVCDHWQASTVRHLDEGEPWPAEVGGGIRPDERVHTSDSGDGRYVHVQGRLHRTPLGALRSLAYVVTSSARRVEAVAS